MLWLLIGTLVLARSTMCENSSRTCPVSCYCIQGAPPDTGLTVKCTNISLHSIPVTVPSAVERLYLDHNLIQDVNTASFSHFSSLREISLSQNRLTDIPDGTFGSNLQQLNSLDLSHNKLTGLPSHLAQTLRTLKLGENQIADLETEKLYSLVALEELHLNHNNIQELKANMFFGKACEECGPAYSKLRKLALNSNIISKMENGAFHGLGHLKALTLAENHLTALKSTNFEGLQELQFLDLSNNKINTIWAKAFEGLPNLKYLYLRGNFMKGIPVELPALEWFDVSWNQITSLDEETHKSTLSSIEIINFANNPLHCNRQLNWLRCLIKDKMHLLKQIKGPYSRHIPSCASPPEAAGELWDSLNDNEISCKSRNHISGVGRFQADDNTMRYVPPKGSKYKSNHPEYLQEKNLHYRVESDNKVKIQRSEITPSSVTMYWDTPVKSAKHERLVVYYYIKNKPDDSPAYHEVVSTQSQHTFHRLTPETYYIICLAPSDMVRSQSSYPKDCIEVQTLPAPSGRQTDTLFINGWTVVGSIIIFGLCLWLSVTFYTLLFSRCE